VHVSNILSKLGASGRTEAVAIASRRGLVPVESSQAGWPPGPPAHRRRAARAPVEPGGPVVRPWWAPAESSGRRPGRCGARPRRLAALEFIVDKAGAGGRRWTVGHGTAPVPARWARVVRRV